MAPEEERRYRFGPLERPGLIMGLRPGQLAVIAVGLVAGVLILRASATPAGLALAAGAVGAASAAALWTVQGRTPADWFPVAGGYALRRLAGRHRHLSRRPRLGAGAGDPSPADTAILGRVRILAVAVEAGGYVGIVRDEAANSWVGALAVSGSSLALLEPAEKARRLEAWGEVLSALARDASPVNRLQWVERCLPDDGDAVGRYIGEALSLPLDAGPVRSYLGLVNEARPVTQQHELLLAVRVDGRRAARAARRAGQGGRGAPAVLIREMRALEHRLAGAGISVEGALTPRMLAKALRAGFDPAARAALARIAALDPERAGTDVGNAEPTAAQESWGAFRADAAHHATYWIAEWPRVEVGPDWMAPLLLQTRALRTVALVMEPVSGARSVRQVEAARTADVADEELRDRAGFLSSARRRRVREGLERREEELSVGYAELRFSGYVTVTAATEAALELACADVEQAAQLSRLDLRRLYGRQREAFTWTLPLGRGLS